MRYRMSLAGQLLALQIGIVCVVLLGVAAISLAQSDARFRETEGGRALAVAETVAATGGVRDDLEVMRSVRLGEVRRAAATDRTVLIRSVAESNRGLSGSTSVVVTDAAGIVLASADPDQLARPLDLPASPLETSRGWVGEVDRGGRTSAVAQVPVISDGVGETRAGLGEVIGVVAVSRELPSLLDNLRLAAPNLLTYLGIASALGVAGSLLLARRVKRQTLGLEPLEITGLVEHRDALLHGIKEGVLALDRQNRITLINDEAIDLLHLSPHAMGKALDDLGLSKALAEVLSGEARGSDLAVPVGERVLILNRMPIASRGRPLGSVTTLRDRTELITLQHKLDAVQQATDTLRAQAHEFSNRLHTISGLIELGEYGEVAGYVHRVTARHAELTDSVTSRIADPAVAALLVAKGSLAAEQGVTLRIAPTSRMSHIDERLSADIATVVGNLVDNALDALDTARPGWVEVEVREDDAEVIVTVSDSGPGVSPALAADVFLRGFSTKTAGTDGQRGIGLSLVRLVCVRRGGEVRLEGDGGAVFVARLPIGAGMPS
ncbi:sensor histidine kinase [Sphaerisporangium album]|uniref:histidine kinase n=1 Tax=Sphaerisporangium album TaxID=509200 RepID=A0A367F6F7_9ACTN|nr:sensor histidine kinase [Sphaerisporangium album]RCG25936.1 sensor histidine kinase [Sphaerisporangium album]